MPEEDKDKKEEEDKVVLKVDMHCEACKASVRKSLRDVPGLENIEINMKEQKVTVKGKVDPRKIFDRVRKKSGRRTELLFPQLKKDVEVVKKEEPKKEEAPEITVELKVKMHCGGCAKQVTRSLEKVDGVSRVKVDMDAEKVIVIGRNIDPSKISQRVVKKTGKHVQIVPPPPPPPPKEPTEEKKEEKPVAAEEKSEEKPAEEKKEEKPAEEEKKEENPAEEKKEENPAAEEKKEEQPAEEKKEEQPAEEKKEEQPAEEKKEEQPAEEKKEEQPAEEKKEEQPAEEKKEEGAENEAKKEEAAESEQQQDGDDDGKADVMRFEYTPMRSIPEYVYPPQLFSDENPNACAIM